MKAKILFVDDEKPLRDTLAKWFRRDYDCLTAPDGESALEIIRQHDDLALMVTDERMPGMTGSELIRKARALRPGLSIIMLTAYGTMELAVEAMRNGGADDFYQKPITDLKSFEPIIAKAVDKHEVQRELEHLKSGEAERTVPTTEGLNDFIGQSSAMKKVYRLINIVAPKDVTVLIEGPSGTGKELVAKAIHRLSKRAKKPFVAVECAAFSKDLLEAELFGYEGGMFTGARKEGKVGCIEAANGGTLFLDEIGEIDLPTQIALLRTLETKCVRRVGGNAEVAVDFRLVAATNRDLSAMVREGKFREDLYYRLKVIDIRTPALSEHVEDIEPLVRKFIGEFAALYSSRVTGIDSAALKKLEQCPWPGNVRQLRNVIEKMVVLAEGDKLSEADLPDEVLPAIAVTPAATPPAIGDNAIVSAGGESLADTEKRHILGALAEAKYNRSKAADALGISRRTLQRKLKEWGINE